MQEVSEKEMGKLLRSIPDTILKNLAGEFLEDTDSAFIKGAVLSLRDLPEFAEFAIRLDYDAPLEFDELERLSNQLDSYLPQFLRSPELFPLYFQSLLVGTVIRETERAVQALVGSSKVWIPKFELIPEVSLCSLPSGAQVFAIGSSFMWHEVARPLSIKVVRETTKALLLASPEGSPLTDIHGNYIADTPELWFPKSALLARYTDGSETQLVLVAKWFVQKQWEAKKERERIAEERKIAAEEVKFHEAIEQVETFIAEYGLSETKKERVLEGRPQKIAYAYVSRRSMEVDADWYAASQTLCVFRQYMSDWWDTLYYVKR